MENTDIQKVDLKGQHQKIKKQLMKVLLNV